MPSLLDRLQSATPDDLAAILAAADACEAAAAAHVARANALRALAEALLALIESPGGETPRKRRKDAGKARKKKEAA